MQVDTDLLIDELVLRGLVIEGPVAVGKHFWIARAPAGDYTFSVARVGGTGGHAGVYRIKRNVEDGYTLLYRSDSTKDFEEIATYHDVDHNDLKPWGLTADGARLLVTGYGGHDTIGLSEFDPQSGKLAKEIL